MTTMTIVTFEGGDGELVQPPRRRWKPALDKRAQPAQVPASSHTKKNIYTVYYTATSIPISQIVNRVHKRWPKKRPQTVLQWEMGKMWQHPPLQPFLTMWLQLEQLFLTMWLRRVLLPSPPPPPANKLSLGLVPGVARLQEIKTKKSLKPSWRYDQGRGIGGSRQEAEGDQVEQENIEIYNFKTIIFDLIMSRTLCKRWSHERD